VRKRRAAFVYAALQLAEELAQARGAPESDLAGPPLFYDAPHGDVVEVAQFRAVREVDRHRIVAEHAIAFRTLPGVVHERGI
jgi:hypothetical protein